MKADTLNPEYLSSQFELEQVFHQRILAEADFERRKQLSVEAYEEAYRRSQALSPDKQSFGFQTAELAVVRPWLEGKDIVDYACGYGSAALFAADFARSVIGFDILDDVVAVCEQRLRETPQPNVRFQRIEPAELPCASESVDVVFGSDMIEHLTPEDAAYFSREVFRALRPGGRFVCITPHKIYGPSDISVHFTEKGALSTGFHLKEYDYASLVDLLRGAGFQDLKTPLMSPRHLETFGQAAGFSMASAMMPFAWGPPAFRVWAEQNSLVLSNTMLRRLLGLNRAVYLVAQKPLI